MFLVFNVLMMLFSVFIFSSTVFAVTSYNFSSSVDGFVARGAATVRYSPDGNGRLYMDTTGSDPGMVKSLSMSASENNVLKTYVWTYCSEKTLQFYFKRLGSTTIYDGGSVILSNASYGGEYIIDLSSNSNWTGTITEIRIDPSVSCGSASIPGFIAFDYVSFEQKPGIVTGGVRNDLTDQPLAGATVYLRQNGITKYQATSNLSGNYTVSNVIPGLYELYCLVNGYEPFGNQITVVSNSNPNNNVALVPNFGTVSGGVRNSVTSEALVNVSVYLRQSGVTKYSAVSDSSGNFTFLNVLVGTYELFCTLSGYNNFGNNITVSAGSNTGNNVALVPNVGSVSGGVRDSATSNPMSNVLVRLEQSGNQLYTTYSSATGNYLFASVTPGTYDLVAIFGGYCNYLKSITVTAGYNYSQNIAMSEAVASIPGVAVGENGPIVGTSYHYTTSGSNVCIGKTIEYRFNWGDGATSTWLVNKYADKVWSTPNPSGYSVIVEARCQENPGTVSFGASLSVYPVGVNTLPNVSITSPQNGATVNLGSTIVTGTANDPDTGGSVQLVQIRVNGGVWQNASGTENWSVSLTLVNGNNIIEAKAQDDQEAWSTVVSISVLKEAPEIVLQSIEFLGLSGLDKYTVQPNPYQASIKATAIEGDPNSIDTMNIILKGAYTDYNSTITLTETDIDSGEYTGTIMLAPIKPSNGEITVSVVETNTWGSDETLIPGSEEEWSWGDGDEFLTFGHALGKAHELGDLNNFPQASISAMQAAGYEKITLDYVGLKSAGLVFPSVFVKCQAEWLLYAGDGYSSLLCPFNPGFVDMGEHDESGCDSDRCYASNIADSMWSDVDVVIFAACSVFNADKAYGIDWFSIDGPEFYLGYRDSAPQGQGIAVIKRWKELVDQGENKALAWMKANGEVLAWNASAYDKVNEKYWYYPTTHKFIFFETHEHEFFPMNLDVESDFQAATGGGFYEPEGVVATVISDNQINLSWNCGINDPGVQWEYYILRSETSAQEDSEVFAKTLNTNFTDMRLMGGTTYYYWIGIRAGDYEPTLSSPVSATTTSSSEEEDFNLPFVPDPAPVQVPSNFQIITK